MGFRMLGIILTPGDLWRSKFKGQGQAIETLNLNISKTVYEIKSIQIGRV